jgi:hypothetical protein
MYRVWHKNLMIWQRSCEWNHWRGEVVLEHTSSVTQSISVAMECWSAEHHAFAVETYFKNNDSVVVTQRIFRQHFNIHRNDSVPSHSTLVLWVRNFRETASATKRKPPGREPAVRTPKNVERVRQAVLRSPRRSANKHTLALRMSDHTVCRIFHKGLNFHTYKMVMVQALSDQDMINRKTVCEDLSNAVRNDNINHVLMTDESNFHLFGCSNSQNCRYGATENPRDIHQQPLHS